MTDTHTTKATQRWEYEGLRRVNPHIPDMTFDFICDDENEDILLSSEEHGIYFIGADAEDKARFLLEAVNSHDDLKAQVERLVAALKSIKEFCTPIKSGTMERVYIISEEALRKAGVEP